MKKTSLLIAFCCLLFVVFLSSVAFSQTITPADAAKIRKLEADKESLERRLADTEASRDRWKKSAGDWKSLAQSETDRADRVQAGRIDNRGAQITVLERQSARDKVEIDRLNRRISSLKRQRWIVGAVSFAGGAATGYIARGKIESSGGNNFRQSPPQFGFTFSF